MFSYLIENLKMIAILMAMYIVSFGVNTLFGVYYNVNAIKEQFSKEKFLSGAAKGAIILVGSALMVVVVSLLPSLIEAFGITMETDLFEDISIAGIAGILLTMTARYLKDAFTKFYNILYKGVDAEADTEEVEDTETTETTTEE